MTPLDTSAQPGGEPSAISRGRTWSTHSESPLLADTRASSNRMRQSSWGADGANPLPRSSNGRSDEMAMWSEARRSRGATLCTVTQAVLNNAIAGVRN